MPMVLMTTNTICHIRKMAVSVQNCVNFQNTAKNHRTSTGKCHRFIPQIPQDFDCRVKTKLKKELLYRDPVIKDEEFKTNYFGDYPRKIVMPTQFDRPLVSSVIEYTRNVEEKLRIEPPAPIPFPLTEMKHSYGMNYIRPQYEEVKAPCLLTKCNVVKLGSEQQPAIQIDQKGYWKWTDPYVTNYKSDYIPYDQVGNILSEKTLTFYNENEFTLPPASGNKTMYDKQIFSSVLPGRLLTRAQDRVRYYGMQSEYQDHYIHQTFSYLYPHLQDRCTTLDDSLPPAGRWQNLAPPGMYCTEYCNIGGLSVRRIVDPGTEKREIKRTENCWRI